MTAETGVDLVTGGDGFIGSALVRTLLERGRRVRVLSLPGVDRSNIDGLDVECLEGDVTRAETLAPAVADVDRVYHLAAVARDYGPRRLFQAVNVAGTASLAKAAAAAGVNRFLLVSSVAVHAYRGLFNADEETPRDARRPAYALSKIAAEEALAAIGRATGLAWTIVRPGTFPFGPRDRTSFAPLADALGKGRFAFVSGGRARVSTAYVENLAEGLVAAATTPDAAGRTYLIADDGALTWRELIERFCDALEVPVPKRSVPAPLARLAGAVVETACRLTGWRLSPPITRYRVAVVARDCHFSNARARTELDWSPRVSLEEGIARTVAWYRGRST